ncbi:hypothetical protein [Pseudomonas japonica]|uniref:hypothetical protein n=1 Tax=Pseudomonas japonica TaxID=256466 RepID=UPI003A83C3B8
MDVRDFEELAGRIEGLARCVLILAGTLQREGQLDQQTLQADFRIAAGNLGSEPTARTLNEMAEQLLKDYRVLQVFQSC